MDRRALLAALGCSLLSLTASAQDATERARVHFEAGTRAFDTGEYEAAVAEFERAYELTRHPDLLFNIYSSAERAGQLERAADALTRFLAEGQVEEARRPVLQRRLANLRERIAARGTETEPREATEPEPAAAAGPAPEPPPPAPTPGGVHPAGVAVLIAAGVLAASFGVFAGLSAAEDGALAQSCAPTCTDAEVSALVAYNTVADVSWIAAAVAGVTGIVLLFALPPEGGGEPRAVLAPWATPHAAGLAAQGRF